MEKPDYIKDTGDGFADVMLARPAKIGGADVGVIRMREPTVRDLEAAQDAKMTEAGKEVFLLSNLCTITPDEVRAMTTRNYKRLQTAFSFFTD